MSEGPTRLQRLIDSRLPGVSLSEFVAERRRVASAPFKPPTAWRRIAEEIHVMTGIEVSDEALRLWYGRDAA